MASYYVRYLKTTLPKLNVPLLVEEQEVFNYATMAKIGELRNALLAAPYYKAVNESSHQLFSEGMNVYVRY